MSTSLLHKSNRLTLSVLLALITSVCVVYFNDADKDARLLLDTHSNRENIPVTVINNNEKTIATAWQWKESNSSDLDDHPNVREKISSSAFSEEAVYNALHRVRLDSQDNVILDHEALIALNATLDDNRLQLNDLALDNLQMIIRQGLPGSAGDEVAKIIANYYQYLGATKEFNAIYETDSPPPQSIENTTEEHEENYRELVSLRELYLGSSVASKLFSTSDANANYMFDMLKIDNATALSDKEKQKKRAEIIARHAEQTINVNNWNQRSTAFSAAKQNILTASISDQEKQTQLTELMHQHFNNEELANVRHLQLDQP
ncbi:MAG: hypothetical protein KBT75_01155 [Oleispira antarctica]|nr:hypothetical protein [Oleispira antarctica]MBQ0790943.1 hypothetical protein [Oleispira antarctica]